MNETEVTLTGHVDPAGHGAITSCSFEYGLETTYGTTVPCSPNPASNPPSSNFTAPTDVTAHASGFSPGTHGHYRLVVSNSAGAGKAGADETFTTTQAPTIDGLASAHLTATTADLNAQVNPDGLESTYRFEYGTTISYGQSAPVQKAAWLLPMPNSRSPFTSPISFRTSSTTTGWLPPTLMGQRRPATKHSTSTLRPVPTKTFASRPRPTTFRTAGPTSLYRQATREGRSFFPMAPIPARRPIRPASASTGLFSTIPGSGGGTDRRHRRPLRIDTDRCRVGVSNMSAGPQVRRRLTAAPQWVLPGSTTIPVWVRRVDFAGKHRPARTQSENGVITNSNMDTFLSFNDGVTLGDTEDLDGAP